MPDNFADKHESLFISHQWGNVQNTFSKKKNYRTGRRGGLFCQSINRNQITSEEYLQMCKVYIHNNPVKHGFCNSPGNWKYSSYNSILSDRPTRVKREDVLSWFEVKKNFIDYHQLNVDEVFAEKFGLR
ncbi:hypothetical protein OU798_09050 [Prolixibacteraceae bacterium Z1-6]|uniref:Transposase n=1 Tax=Draconibacterium aestuarii TaxID=2998507 RepID=A0A9X3F4I9_9BACT|nr:hypothetical protein [Prolixibacteraceae bacterium Z1-6]